MDVTRDYTTLQVAERITRAVLKAVDSDEIALAPHDTYFGDHELAGVVFQAMRECSVWFARVDQDQDGVINGQALEEREAFKAALEEIVERDDRRRSDNRTASSYAAIARHALGRSRR